MYKTTIMLLLVITTAVIGNAAAEVELRLKPLDETVTKELGSSILFTCEIFGGSPREEASYSLQWLNKDNQEITEKTGRLYVEEEKPSTKKLYITNIEQKDEGTYMCVASSDEHQLKKSVKLVLYKAITFDHAPSPQHPSIYSNALIECRVSGTPMPTVSWTYKGERIVYGGRYTEELFGLRIKNITLNDDGEYICRAEVESEGRYNQRRISIFVHIPPTITEGPGESEGIEGEEITISCKADGLPAPKYEFIKDDNMKPLQSTSRIHVDADSGSVTFRPLNKSDEGTYTCRANNDVGSRDTHGYLRVLVKPQIYQFSGVIKTEGQSATLFCLSHGYPSPVMTFRKAGRETDYALGENEDGRVVVSKFEDKLQLDISSVIPEDMSNYTCKSKSDIGSSEQNAMITVNFRPRFPKNHTKVVYIWAGKSRNITCNVLSHPDPIIEWYHMGRLLANNDTYRIFDLGKQSSLQVRVRESDQGWIYGNYTCRVSNELGTSELPIDLRRATVPSEPRAIFVEERRPNSIVIGVQPPEESGGEEVVGYRVEYEEKTQEFDKVNVSQSSFGTTPSYSSNLAMFDVQGSRITIENLKPSTTYVLKVRAKNDVGVGRQTEHTIVTESVRKPYPIKVISPSEGTELKAFQYTVEWEKPHTGGLAITEYEFRLRKVTLMDKNETKIVDKVDDWVTRSSPDDSKDPMVRYTLDNLTPRTTYQLEVRARNDIGWSDFSKQFIFETREPTGRELQSIHASASLGIVVGVVVAIFIIILVVIDLACCFVNDCGVTRLLCVHVCGRKQYGKEKALEEGESNKALQPGQEAKQEQNSAAEQKLKDSLPDGKNDDTKEEITLKEKDKLMDNK